MNGSADGKRIAIIGGGIAGLSIAYAVGRREPSASVIVLERSPQPGGNIRTEVADGYTCEWGPDGFLDNAPATLALVQALGIGNRLQISSDAARRRFIFRGSQLHEVPTSPLAFLQTGLLSAGAKLRLLCEPFGSRPPQGDESIHDFATRRIGREAASVMVGSMVSGIFAGDAQALSLKACFPRMWELEHEHGSLVRALIATRKTRRKDDTAGAPAGRLTSFKGGMTDLIAGLQAALGDIVRTSAPVLSLARRPEGTWRLEIPGGSLDADAVVLAGPAAESAGLVRALDAAMADELDAIRTAPLAVVCLGFDAAAAGPLNGFGFLVPRSQGVRILGALWETSIYPDRAPHGKALMRVMIGGATDPAALDLDDEALLRTVRDDLKQTMGLAAPPEFVKIIRHRRGIPQYVLGHVERMARLEAMTGRHGSLVLAGNSYRGVSINSCIAEADGLAARVLDAAVDRRAYPLAG
jgi:oxygen-dependent protoporphyrinogen oxidase